MLSSIVKALKNIKYSDIQITVGKRISYRTIKGFQEIDSPVVTKEMVLGIAKECFSYVNGKTANEIYNKFLIEKEFDGAFNIDDERFRISLYFSLGAIAISLRRLQNKVYTLEELHIKESFSNYLDQGGLLLLSGVVSSGKTTTAVALLNKFAHTKHGYHIISLEDPVEYLIPHGNCIVDQREIYTDIPNLETALTSIVRENPDIIFFGEIRNSVMAETALLLASTGHVVIATFHAYPIIRTFERFMSLIKKDNISLFASSFTAVISQTLEYIKGSFYPIFEVVENTQAIRSLIIDGKIREFESYRGNGYQITYDDSRKELFHSLNLDSIKELNRK